MRLFPPMAKSRRSFLGAGIAAASLGACEPFGVDYKTMKTALAVATGLEDPPGITLEQASAVPYASVGIRLGGSGEAMLILASDTGGTLLWTSSERIAITTKDGRIVASGGFQWNLSHLGFPSGDPLAGNLNDEKPAPSALRIFDFQDVNRFSVPVDGLFEVRGPEKISVLGTELETTAVIETCTCRTFDWSFKNVFWIDRESGVVWRSRQSIHPNLPPITTTVLRPPG